MVSDRGHRHVRERQNSGKALDSGGSKRLRLGMRRCIGCSSGDDGVLLGLELPGIIVYKELGCVFRTVLE